MQGPLQGPQAAGFSYVLARLEIQGECLIGYINWNDEIRSFDTPNISKHT